MAVVSTLHCALNLQLSSINLNNRKKCPHLPSDRFIWLRINSSSTDVGENNAVTFEFVNALQWSFIGGLLAANASGMYHPNLKDILHVIITHFTS